MPETPNIQPRLKDLERLLEQQEQSANPAEQARLQEIVSGLLEIHGSAIQRILEHVAAAGQRGAAIIDVCAHDESLAPVLVLHGLHPLDFETRINAALEKVRPYLAKHGGQVELLSLSEGLVHLKLEGNCHGCPSSRATMQSLIEQEIYSAAPEVTAISVDGLIEEPPEKPAPDHGFVPLASLAINGSTIHAAAS